MGAFLELGVGRQAGRQRLAVPSAAGEPVVEPPAVERVGVVVLGSKPVLRPVVGR